MAFLPNSRYFGLPTIRVRISGIDVEAVKLRRLPTEVGDSHACDQHDRLDILAQNTYSDGTRFWHIADANTELEANHLIIPGRVIRIPRQ